MTLSQTEKAAEVMSAAFGKFIGDEIPARRWEYISARTLWIPDEYGVPVLELTRLRRGHISAKGRLSGGAKKPPSRRPIPRTKSLARLKQAGTYFGV